jgi:hypothetical protein
MRRGKGLRAVSGGHLQHRILFVAGNTNLKGLSGNACRPPIAGSMIRRSVDMIAQQISNEYLPFAYRLILDVLKALTIWVVFFLATIPIKVLTNKSIGNIIRRDFRILLSIYMVLYLIGRLPVYLPIRGLFAAFLIAVHELGWVLTTVLLVVFLLRDIIKMHKRKQ